MAKRLRNTRKKKGKSKLHEIREVIQNYWSPEGKSAKERITRIALALGSSLPFFEPNNPVLTFQARKKRAELDSDIMVFLRVAHERAPFDPGVRFGNAERVRLSVGQGVKRRDLAYVAGWLVFCRADTVEVMPWAWNLYRNQLLDVSWDHKLVDEIFQLSRELKNPTEIAQLLRNHERDFNPIFGSPPKDLFYVGTVTDLPTAQAMADFWVRDNVSDLGFFNTTENALLQATMGALVRLRRGDRDASKEIQKGTEGEIQGERDPDGGGSQE